MRRLRHLLVCIFPEFVSNDFNFAFVGDFRAKVQNVGVLSLKPPYKVGEIQLNTQVHGGNDIFFVQFGDLLPGQVTERFKFRKQAHTAQLDGIVPVFGFQDLVVQQVQFGFRHTGVFRFLVPFAQFVRGVKVEFRPVVDTRGKEIIPVPQSANRFVRPLLGGFKSLFNTGKNGCYVFEIGLYLLFVERIAVRYDFFLTDNGRYDFFA